MWDPSFERDEGGVFYEKGVFIAAGTLAGVDADAYTESFGRRDRENLSLLRADIDVTAA